MAVPVRADVGSGSSLQRRGIPLHSRAGRGAVQLVKEALFFLLLTSLVVVVVVVVGFNQV